MKTWPTNGPNKTKEQKKIKNMNTNQKQQGDVLFHKVNCPINLEDGKRVSPKNGYLILAEGEVTGHFHGIALEEDEAELIRLEDSLLLSLKEPKTVQHQEHKPVTLEPGIWQIGQVVEKDWLSGMERKVQD